MAFETYGDCVYGEGAYKGVDVAYGPNDRMFRFLPDWKAGIQFSYYQETVIAKARLLKEQRRPLLNGIKRIQTFEAWNNKINAGIEVFLKLNHARYIYMPVYVEPVLLEGNGSLNGESSVTAKTSIQYFYNLQSLTDIIMLINLATPSEGTLATLDSITGNFTINLKEPLTIDYLKEQTVLYPCMYGALERVRLTDQVDTITKYKMTIKEWY